MESSGLGETEVEHRELMDAMKAQRKRRAAEARQQKEDEAAAAAAAVAAAATAAAVAAEAAAAAEAEAQAAAKAQQEREADEAEAAAAEVVVAAAAAGAEGAGAPSVPGDGGKQGTATQAAAAAAAAGPIVVEVERQKLDFSGTREMFFSGSEVVLTVSDLSVTRQGAPALDNHEAWVEVGVGTTAQLSSVTSARVRKRGGLRWVWHEDLQLHVPKMETVATLQFCSNAHESPDAVVTHEIGLASLRSGEPVHVVLEDNAETKVRATLLLTKETKERLHAVHKKLGAAAVLSPVGGGAAGTPAGSVTAPVDGTVHATDTTVGDLEQRSTTVRHQSLELKNRERASALIVPRLNDQQLPYRLHDVPVADFQRFIVHQFAIDLINHWKTDSNVIDQLSGNVPMSRVDDADKDMGIAAGILLLAGDGRLKDKYITKVKPELLQALEMPELSPEHQYRGGGNYGGWMPYEARDLGDQADPLKPRLYYTQQIADNLDEWFARGIAGAIARSVIKGRGIIVVDGGYETELVSRLSHHLSMWRMPTLRIVGVAMNDKDARRPERAARKMDVNHSHFVVCPKPVQIQGLNGVADEEMVMGQTSLGVDTVEKIAEAFELTTQQIFAVRAAARQVLSDVEQQAPRAIGNGKVHKAGVKRARDAKVMPEGAAGAAQQQNARVELPAANPVPKVCLVVNGGKRAKVDVLNAVRNNWDLIVVKGTGGLADWIALNWAVQKRLHEAQEGAANSRSALADGSKEPPITEEDILPERIRPGYDPVVHEIVTYGRMTILDIFSPNGTDDLTKLLSNRLNRGSKDAGGDFVLEHAWCQFATFRATAKDERASNTFYTYVILLFSSLTTWLAVTALEVRAAYGIGTAYNNMAICVAIAPILLAFVTAIKNRFHASARWMQLHLIAQQMLREIFMYRAMGTSAYENAKFRHAQLAARLSACEKSLLSSEAAMSQQVEHDKSWVRNKMDHAKVLDLQTNDDILATLDAGRYVEHRLQERLNFYRKDAASNYRMFSSLSWMSYLIGGVSTLLVMFDRDPWAAVTVALQSTLSTLVSTERYEVNMIRSNHSKVALEELRDWWHSLSETQQMYSSKRKQLVEGCERIIDAHIQGWLATFNDKDEQQEAQSDVAGAQAGKGDKVHEGDVRGGDSGDEGDGQQSDDEEDYLRTARGPLRSKAGLRPSNPVLERNYEQTTVANAEWVDVEAEDEEKEENDLHETKERDAGETVQQQSQDSARYTGGGETEQPEGARPLAARLRTWAQSTLLQLSAVDQSAALVQLPTQANALGPKAELVKMSLLLSLRFRNSRKARAMVLPHVTDFRTLPDVSVNNFVNHDLFAHLSAKAEATSASSSATKRGESAAYVGLGVILLAGDGQQEALLEAEATKQRQGMKGRALRAEKQKQARLRQYLCRGVPDAVSKLAVQNVGTVIVDSGRNSTTTNLLANAMIAAWRFESARVVGVIERSAADKGGEAFSDIDEHHTHVVMLKERKGIDSNFIEFPDIGMKRTSPKVDVASKIAHSFVAMDLCSGPPPSLAELDLPTNLCPKVCEVPASGSSVTDIKLLGSDALANERHERRSSLAKSRSLANKYKLGHAVQLSAELSEKLAPEDVQWNLNTGDLLNRLHGKDKAANPKDLSPALAAAGPAARPWASHVVLLIGGGETARVDMLQAVRLGWDIIVFNGTGGLADSIAARLSDRADELGGVGNATGRTTVNAVEDEIVCTGKLAVIDVEHNSIEDVASLVYSRVMKGRSSAETDAQLVSTGPGAGNGLERENILRHAWTMYAEYRMTAKQLQRRFHVFEGILMFMALWTTLLVALDSDLRYNTSHWSKSVMDSYAANSRRALKVFIGITPILISVILSVKNRFQYPAKFTALAEQAAAIKREIYHYRTNTSVYRDAKFRKHALAVRLKDIGAKLMTTPAAETAIVQCTVANPITAMSSVDSSGQPTQQAKLYREVMDLQKGDNGVHDIAVDEYTRVRLDHTVGKYRASARHLHNRLKLLENTGYILTGLCTALILVNEEAWVASVIVLVNITSNIAAVGMLEDRLMRLNVAIVKAANLSSWWRTLEEGEQIKVSCMNKCVETMETVIMAITVGSLPSFGGSSTPKTGEQDTNDVAALPPATVAAAAGGGGASAAGAGGNGLNGSGAAAAKV